MHRGRFITLEGGEGVGKSTQARLLADHLRAEGREVVVTREPGGSALAERIRDLLLDPAMPAHSQLAEALLFNAARADHLDAVIRPALAQGAWVICDRFLDSTRVYQGVVGGLDGAQLDAMDALVVAPTYPDLTVVIDLDPVVGMARAVARRGGLGAMPADRYEAREAEYHQRLRQAFLNVARAEAWRCVVVDGAQDVEAIASEIRGHATARLIAAGAMSGPGGA
jgi:dTMP kinase